MLTPGEAYDAVRYDVSAVLEQHLPAGDDDGAGFSVPEPFGFVRDRPIGNEDPYVTVIPWEWRGQNLPRGEEGRGLFGLEPTYRRVTVRGSTIVTEENGEPVFRRYIDWLDVLAEAGISVYTRPIVDVRAAFERADLDEVPELAEALRQVEEAESKLGGR